MVNLVLRVLGKPLTYDKYASQLPKHPRLKFPQSYDFFWVVGVWGDVAEIEKRLRRLTYDKYASRLAKPLCPKIPQSYDFLIQNSRFKIQNYKQSRVVSNYSRLLFMGVMGIIGIMGMMGV